MKIIRHGFKLLTRRPKGWLNVLVNQTFALLKIPYAPLLPVELILEPINICDLRCPVCETGAGILNRKKGKMGLGNFERIINQFPDLNRLQLYFMGEPFLNKEIYKMIQLAIQKKILVSICTNGQTLDSEKLLQSGLSEINFQIGGTTQSSHATYRINGDLEKTLENLKELIQMRNQQKAEGIDSGLSINMGFIVMKHNEDEIEDAIKLGNRLGVDKVEIISPCVRNMGQAEAMLPENEDYWIYDRKAFQQGILKPGQVPRNRCWYIWHSMTVCWNGDVVLCCRDARAEFPVGNVFQEDIKKIWNGKRIKELRKKVMFDQADLKLCDLCSGYGVPLIHR